MFMAINFDTALFLIPKICSSKPPSSITFGLTLYPLERWNKMLRWEASLIRDKKEL